MSREKYLLTCAQRRLWPACACADWSESSLSAWRNFASLAIQNAPSEDSDQTARMRRLIWIFAGRTCPTVRFLTLRFNYKSNSEARRAHGIVQLINTSIQSIGKLVQRLLFSSPEHEVLMVSYCGESVPPFVVRRASCGVNNCFKSLLLLHPWADWRYLVGSIGVTCRSKVAKIVPIRNPRWPQSPPSWKSVFRFFSWTESQLTPNLIGSIGVTCRSKIAKIMPIENPDLENLFFASSPKPKSQLTPNLVGSTRVTYRSNIVKSLRSDIQDCRHGGHLENLFFVSSSELKCHLTRNLAGSIGTTCRSKHS